MDCSTAFDLRRRPQRAHPQDCAPRPINSDVECGAAGGGIYTDVAGATPARVVPRCFEAIWDKVTNAWHLLLEDLTETHVIASTWRLPPSTAQCESMVEAWARFHAPWWDDPRLGVSVGMWGDDLDAYLQRFAAQFAAFADRHGDRLPPERRDLHDRLLRAAPRLSARNRTHRNLTIIHGDSHAWNCLLPRDCWSNGRSLALLG